MAARRAISYARHPAIVHKIALEKFVGKMAVEVTAARVEQDRHVIPLANAMSLDVHRPAQPKHADLMGAVDNAEPVARCRPAIPALENA